MKKSRWSKLKYYLKYKPIILLSRYERWRKVADLIHLSREGRKRLDWIIYYETTAKFNATRTARHFGIARKTLYGVLNRFDSAELKALEDRSRAPHTVRTRTITALEERRVISLRKELIHFGKEKLRTEYNKRYSEDISAHKILYTIQKHDLYPKSSEIIKLRKKRKHYRVQRKIANLKLRNTNTLGFLIQIDTVVLHLAGVKRYILTAIDRFGKIAFARAYRTHSSYSAADFLERLQFLLEDQIVNIQTDHGSEFAHAFEEACTDLGIVHYFSRVRTPKDNAVVERFNRTLQEEWLNDSQFTADCSVLNKRLTEWLIFYNYHRPHWALGNLTPMEYCVKTKRVLPMYPTGTQCCNLVPILLILARYINKRGARHASS